MTDLKPATALPASVWRHALLAGIVSLLLSIWTMALGNAANNDGVLYLLTAEAWLSGGWTAASTAYPWPFYSILIAELSRLGLSLELSAWMLNVMAMMALASGFVVAAGRLSTDRWHLRWAVVLILALPALNLLRSDIVRDIPFLALFIWYVERALAYVAAPSWRRLLVSTGLLLLAFLFRLEAAIFLLALPLHALLAIRGRDRGRFRRIAIPIASVMIPVLLGLVMLINQSEQTRLADFERYLAMLKDFSSSFSQRAEQLADVALHHSVRNYDQEALLVVLLTIFVGKWLKAAGWLHVAVFLGFRQYVVQQVAPTMLVFVRSLFLLAILPPFIMVLLTGVSASRYFMPAVLLFLLLCPFAYVALLQRWPKLRTTIVAILLLLFVLGNKASFVDRTSTIREAGQWLRQQSGSVWCNDQALCYYANRHDVERDRNYPWREWSARWQQDSAGYDRVALVLPRNDQTTRQAAMAVFGAEPEREFVGPQERKVLVFSRKPQP